MQLSTVSTLNMYNTVIRAKNFLSQHPTEKTYAIELLESELGTEIKYVEAKEEDDTDTAVTAHNRYRLRGQSPASHCAEFPSKSPRPE